jgi:hypothetical protein
MEAFAQALEGVMRCTYYTLQLTPIPQLQSPAATPCSIHPKKYIR